MTAVARRFLTAEQVQNLHRLYVNPTGEGTAALLDSAVQSPINHKHYEGENDMVNLAALLATKLIKNHPFGDGNIRAALIAANAFLSMNGKMIQKKPLNPADGTLNVTLADIHVQVATGECDEKRLAEVYRPLVRNFTEVTEDVADMIAKGTEE